MLAGVPPPALLDATDRHLDLRLGGHQDRRVQDAVLLGPTKFLAFEEQHAAVAGVLDQEFGDGAALADFLDGDGGGGDGFVGKLVLGRLAGFGVQREDGQRVAGERLADLKLRQLKRHGRALLKR